MESTEELIAMLDSLSSSSRDGEDRGSRSPSIAQEPPLPHFDFSGGADDEKWKSRLLEVGYSSLSRFMVDFLIAAPAQDAVLDTVLTVLKGDAPVPLSALLALSKSTVKKLVGRLLDDGRFIDEALDSIRLMLADTQAADIHRRMQYAIAVSQRRVGAAPSFDGASFESLGNRLPSCYQKAIDDVLKSLRRESGGKAPVILIKSPDGAPGEKMVEAICAAFDSERKAVTVDCTALSSGIDLFGVRTSYVRSRPGEFLERMSLNPEACIVVKGISSIRRYDDEHGDTLAWLQTLLSSRCPVDAYLAAPMNVAAPIVLLDDADADTPTAIRVHCDYAITLPRLNRAEKIDYVRNEFGRKGLVAASQGVIDAIVDGFAYDEGIKLAERAVNRLSEEVGSGSVVTEQLVRDTLPAPDGKDLRYIVGGKRPILKALPEYEAAVDRALNAALEDSKRGNPASAWEKKLRLLVDSLGDGGLYVPTEGELTAAFEDTHPCMDAETLRKLSEAVIASVCCEHPRPILLVGPAGTGKTSICKTLAEALRCDIHKFDAPGLTADELFGSQGFHPSALVEAAALSKGRACLMHIDEVDKLPSAIQLFCSLLDEGIVNDYYLGVSLQLNRHLFVLTANRESDISPLVLNRCRVVHFEGYTIEEKRQVASYVFARKAKEMGGLILRQENMNALIDTLSFDDGAGLRGLEDQIEVLLSKGLCEEEIASRNSKQQTAGLYLTQMQRQRRAFALLERGGVRGGVATASIAVASSRGRGTRIVPDIPVLRQAVDTAMSALDCSIGHGFTGANVSVGGVEGVEDANWSQSEFSIVMALWRMSTGRDALLDGVAFMGEVDPTGAIMPACETDLRKARFFVSRAMQLGVNTLVCPANLELELREKSLNFGCAVSVVGVRTCEEAMNFCEARETLWSEIEVGFSAG